MNESCHTFEWVVSHIGGIGECARGSRISFRWVMSHICMSYVMHMNEPCHTCEWIMSHIWIRQYNTLKALHILLAALWISHIAHMNESHHAYECVMSHIWMSHVAHLNASCHACEWVMSHTWMRHVTHMKKSCRTSQALQIGMSHTLHSDVALDVPSRVRHECDVRQDSWIYDVRHDSDRRKPPLPRRGFHFGLFDFKRREEEDPTRHHILNLNWIWYLAIRGILFLPTLKSKHPEKSPLCGGGLGMILSLVFDVRHDAEQRHFTSRHYTSSSRAFSFKTHTHTHIHIHALTNECVMSHIKSTIHIAAHLKKAFSCETRAHTQTQTLTLAYEYVMSHIKGRIPIVGNTFNGSVVMSHVWMSRVTHMNKSCRTYEWVMSHVCMHHVTHMNESCRTSKGLCI